MSDKNYDKDFKVVNDGVHNYAGPDTGLPSKTEKFTTVLQSLEQIKTLYKDELEKDELEESEREEDEWEEDEWAEDEDLDDELDEDFEKERDFEELERESSFLSR